MQVKWVGVGKTITIAIELHSTSRERFEDLKFYRVWDKLGDKKGNHK